MIVTIDGPAASGKNTIAKILADKLNFTFLPTGNIYRALAKKIDELQIDSTNIEKIVDVASDIKIEDLADPALAADRFGILASQIAIYPEVRDSLLVFQRSFANLNLIVEGRDVGTVVFPNAEIKIFITANQEVRAKRRYFELVKSNPDASLEKILQNLKIRDEQDQSRKIAPLIPAKDAVIIDSSNLSIDEVVTTIANIIYSHNKVILKGTL